ncbi:hypothetical protein [Metalysinibacillus jejuensis]|uniref:hypothetical protein n=1 Tax=Metalysinibacillus jejuensis TaxID=914327 RepID=UPI000D3502A9|nr:hypothetical protein [Metalysinibacillus jejuensis]
MKIGYTTFPQPIVLKRDKNEKTSVAEGNALQQMATSKQALKETVQRQLSEMQEARTDMGEDDPKAQRYIEKFKSGKKLTPEEMAYVRQNAPGMVDYIDRIMREREVIELSMKMAPTKTDVQMVAFRASKQIEKHQIPEEREIRAKHLVDAKHEYEQTEEYKEKPNSPLDKQEKPVKVRYKRSEKETLELAKTAYEPVKLEKKEPSIQHEQ